jgi:hypothetical protein
VVFLDKTGNWFLVLCLGLWAQLLKERKKSVKANGFGLDRLCGV